MRFNHKKLAFALALLWGVGVTGCSKKQSTTQVAETKNAQEVSSALDQSTNSEVERSILQKNTVAINVPVNQEAVNAIPKGFKFAEDGYFTVAVISLVAPPLHVVAEDNKTHIGADVDVARLIADSLGLKLKVVPTSWENWPLGVLSGKVDAAITNITVTKERKDKFDFATYKKDMLGFYTAKTSKLQAIKAADDISGLKIIVEPATNQEKVLLEWIADNKKKGLKPAEPIYLTDYAAARLALQSGRADATFGPNVHGAWQVKNGAAIKLVGLLEGGWPKTADIGVTIKKGNGLVQPVQIALNGVIKSGEYNQAFTRWGIQEEEISQSLINPLGLGD